MKRERIQNPTSFLSGRDLNLEGQYDRFGCDGVIVPENETFRLSKIRQIVKQKDAPRLSLRIINGNSTHYNQVLEITPLGLVGSLRGEEDGYVYFGTLKHSMPDTKGRFTVINDYVLPPFQLPSTLTKSGQDHALL